MHRPRNPKDANDSRSALRRAVLPEAGGRVEGGILMASWCATRRHGRGGALARAAVLLAATAVLTAGCDNLKTRSLLNEGNKLYRGQKYEEAIQKYQEILKYDNDNWDANYQIAVSYLATYHPGSSHEKDVEAADHAIASLERLLQLKAPSPEVLGKVRGFYVGILTDANRTEKAVAYYQSLLEKDPNNVELILQMAQLYAKKGNFEGAMEYFTKRANLEPENKEAWYTVGVLCWERSYRGAALITPEERAAVVEKGLQMMDKALAIDPDYFDALSYTNLLYREKAKVLAGEGRMDEALAAQDTANAYVKKALEARKKAAPAGAPAKPAGA